jgi:hypothetical protein
MCHEGNVSTLRTILKFAKSATHISLMKSRHITDEIIEEIAQNCKLLTHFHISQCDFVQVESVVKVLQNCVLLENFTSFLCNKLVLKNNLAKLSTEIQNYASSLTHFSGSLSKNETMILCFGYGANLLSLKLSPEYGLSHFTLAIIIGDHCPNLQKLKCAFEAETVSDETIAILIRSCKDLIHLDFTGGPKFDNKAIISGNAIIDIRMHCPIYKS